MDLHFAKGYLTEGSKNGTGMDHVRLLSTQAGEHTAYTTMQAFSSNHLKAYNGPLKRRDKQRRGNQGPRGTKTGTGVAKRGERKDREEEGKNM